MIIMTIQQNKIKLPWGFDEDLLSDSASSSAAYISRLHVVTGPSSGRAPILHFCSFSFLMVSVVSQHSQQRMYSAPGCIWAASLVFPRPPFPGSSFSLQYYCSATDWECRTCLAATVDSSLALAACSTPGHWYPDGCSCL